MGAAARERTAQRLVRVDPGKPDQHLGKFNRAGRSMICPVSLLDTLNPLHYNVEEKSGL